MISPPPSASSRVYFPALDGIRALAVCLVMYFHFWQQNWLQPFFVDLIFLRIDLYPAAAAGFIGVELLFVLSGFLLYLPYAHAEIRDIVSPHALGKHYTKRLIRIVPSYWLCVIVCAFFARDQFNSISEWLAYTGKNLLFLNMFSPDLIYNRINSVLWSMSVEMWFYIVFPILAFGLRKRPALLTGLCFALGFCYRNWVLRYHRFDMIIYMNQLIGMIDCFVGGMFAAHIVSSLRGLKTKTSGAMVALLGGGLFCMFLWLLNHQRGSPQGIQFYQIACRSGIVIASMMIVSGAALAGSVAQKILGSRAFRLVSMCSFNLYLWHQWLSVRLKEWHFPPAQTMPETNDPVWQWQHMLLSFVGSLALAALVTFLFDRPVTGLLNRLTLGRQIERVSG